MLSKLVCSSDVLSDYCISCAIDVLVQLVVEMKIKDDLNLLIPQVDNSTLL